MNDFLSRASIRLLVPAMALTALFALGEPIPSQAAMPESEQAQIEVGGTDPGDMVVIAIRQEVEAINAEAQAARATAHRTASRMRWAMTLPAASSSKSCLVTNCGG